MSLGGPIAFAGANFLVLVLLQRTAGPAEFGMFGFMQIAIATGMGLINGVFAAPLTLALGPGAGHQRPVVGSFFISFAAFTVAGLVLATVLIWIAGASLAEVGLLAAAALCMWLRWYLRSLSLAVREQNRATVCDLVYAAASLGVNGAYLLFSPLSVEVALAAQIIACLVSLVPLSSTLLHCLRAMRGAGIADFRSEFARTGKWSTLMVITSEVVANVHAYAIVLVSGSAAFAPIALATLIFRPHGVILTGSVIFERPRMVARVHAEGAAAVARDVFYMRAVLGFVWIGNVAAAALLVIVFQDRVLSHEYDRTTTFIAVCLTAAVVLARSMREPAVVALQALQSARPAAGTSLVAALVTVPLVVAALALAAKEPAWSLVGTLCGEIVSLILASHILRSRVQDAEPPAAPARGEAR